jgi:Fe-S-cluster containining protein
MKKPRPRKPSHPVPARTAAKDPNRAWVEAQVLGDGDLLAYGRLAEEIDDLAPEVLWQELRAAAERYLAGGPERTTQSHQRVDATLEALIARDQRFGYPPPFCHKGCSNCCHELVYCTSEEALGIHRHCQAAGIAIDHGKLRRQLRYLETDAQGDHTGVTRWNDQDPADQSCVFLDPADGSCRIWQVRPLVCRVHLAEHSDRHCRPHNGVENPEARAISYLEVGYILSAIFTIHQDSIKRTMGRLLLDLAGNPASP